ncbi:MAG: DUF4136 domain-containing protein [Candidatus Aminicenantes bacterium]
MRSITTFFIISLLIFSASCTSTKVQFDYDRQEDFSQFRTYSFIPLPDNLKTEISPMVVRRIEEAIALTLGDKGFQRTEASPDFLVAIHLESKDKFDVQNWGYTYAPYDLYWRGAGYWGTGGITVQQYQQGTLIIDVVKTADKELVWRGVGTKALSPNPTPKTMDRNVNEVVSKILADFPPQKK